MLDIRAYGRIASDIPLKQSKDKKHLYTQFLLATHPTKDETTFIRCVAFDAMATMFNNYFVKGDRIVVKGELISDDYNGSKFVFKIKVLGFEFVETLDEHRKHEEKHGSNKKERK